MPLSHLAKMPRRFQIGLVLFVIASFIFIGALISQVTYSSDRRERICVEVKDLRHDVVQALDILTKNSQQPNVVRARGIIKKPNC